MSSPRRPRRPAATRAKASAPGLAGRARRRGGARGAVAHDHRAQLPLVHLARALDRGGVAHDEELLFVRRCSTTPGRDGARPHRRRACFTSRRGCRRVPAPAAGWTAERSAAAEAITLHLNPAVPWSAARGAPDARRRAARRGRPPRLGAFATTRSSASALATRAFASLRRAASPACPSRRARSRAAARGGAQGRVSSSRSKLGPWQCVWSARRLRVASDLRVDRCVRRAAHGGRVRAEDDARTPGAKPAGLAGRP